MRALITEGQLGIDDEVCRANHYWVFLHEREEIFEQLGISVPKAPRSKGGPDDEVTEETETPTALLEMPARAAAAHLAQQAAHSGSDFSGIPEHESTAMISSVQLASSRAGKGSHAGPHTGGSTQQASLTPHVAGATHPRVMPARRSEDLYRPDVPSGGIEPTSMWRGLAYVLALVTGFILVMVLRRLQG